MNSTTKTFPRRCYSGTEYAASIERTRRSDISGQIIAFAVCAAIVALTFYVCWRSI